MGDRMIWTKNDKQREGRHGMLYKPSIVKKNIWGIFGKKRGKLFYSDAIYRA